jgi:quercetin dioxygenase-like cupin family protein
LERFAFTPETALAPQHEFLHDVTIAPLTRPLSDETSFQVAVFRVAPGGSIARHTAAVAQILAVIEGSGEVSGADGVLEAIAAGEAVYWAEGEEHETRTDTGLTALVLEGPDVVPFRPRT